MNIFQECETIDVFGLNGKRLISKKVLLDYTALFIGKLSAGMYKIFISAKDGTVICRNVFRKE
jgi:hypothetical protein